MLPLNYTRLWLTVIVATFVAGCQSGRTDVVITDRTMGTTYTVRIAGCALADCEGHYRALIGARLAELNGIFSHYDPDSELSRFNRHDGTDWFAVTPELAEVAALALQVSVLSDGAFDVTVAPAVDAWGFGPTERRQHAPDDIERATLIKRIDYRQLTARTDRPALRKTIAGLSVDLSAIAKGYAVDQLAYLLEGDGMTNYLVEIGGEVRSGGVRADGQPWRIGIEQPENNDGPTIEYIVTPGSMAVASSGDYRNYYRQDGRRVSHTIDPATAMPVTNDIAAVSVIAPSAAQADALATALMAMGENEGMALAEREQLAVLISTRNAGGLRTRYTPAFAAYLLR